MTPVHLPRRLSSHAFTLIELLVVISILVVLMGLLIPAVSMVRGKAKVTKTRAFLSQIEAACGRYKNENGMYPEANMGATSWSANASALYNQLHSIDRENFRDGNLKDAFGSEIYYRPAKTYPFDDSKTVGLIDSAEPPKADSYQLWSLGSNKRDDVSPATDPKDLGDDIVIWDK
jgi:prepilin-type N-terminal cleavage/methylation domain-containing protein